MAATEFARSNDPANSPGRSPAIRAVDVTRNFGGTRALKGVSLATERQTIHALVGENGAGKSTFLGTIAGRITPTSGEISIFGQRVEHVTPRRARALGIAAIYQELTIVPAMTALANVFLGQTLTANGVLAQSRMRKRYEELCAKLGVSIPALVPAGRLSVADQQMLEIMRGIQSNAKILLFDEPTTALAPPERQSLFRIMRELQADGSTLMLVSHNLDEVMAIADTITVFRDGEIAASARTGEWTKREIVRAMIGRDLHGERHQRIRATSQAGAKPLLSVRNASLSGAFSNVNIELYPGEIVGIGGLVGSGRSSLLRSLAGVEPHSDGAMEVASRTVRWPHTPRQALKLGIALVPEDRKIQGLVPGMTAMANICLAGLSKVSRFGYVSSRTMLETTRPIAREFGFAEGRLETPVRNLSGGNQQKVLLARWRHHAPRILLVDEPTRGIDVGAKQEILATLRRLADQGLGIIMVSSELEEIVDTCERVYVLAEGRQVAHFDGSKPINVDDILHAAFNVEPT